MEKFQLHLHSTHDGFALVYVCVGFVLGLCLHWVYIYIGFAVVCVVFASALRKLQFVCEHKLAIQYILATHVGRNWEHYAAKLHKDGCLQLHQTRILSFICEVSGRPLFRGFWKKGFIRKYGSIFYVWIGQVKNGCLYLRYMYGSSSKKTTANWTRTLTDKKSFLYCS